MLGATLLRASQSRRLREALESIPVTKRVVDRFVAGEDRASAIAAATRLHAQGMSTTLVVLGEHVTSAATAQAMRDQYLDLLRDLHQAGAAASSEVSLKLSAVGQALPGDGQRLALTHAQEICAAADEVGCLLTLDMEDHTTTDATLGVAADLRASFPTVGNAIQANLLRTPADLPALAAQRARVRLVKGAYKEPAEVAHQRKPEVDEAYLDLLRLLMGSDCHPMVATHDQRMIRAAQDLAARFDRSPQDWEVQMLYGIGTDLQRDLVRAGVRVRVYIPFGTDWYGYFMRRLAERPANVAFFLRALVKG